jgi:hypothetical protein
VAVAGSLESPRFPLSGKPATAVIRQTMAENEPSKNYIPGIHMSTPVSKGLTDAVPTLLLARPAMESLINEKLCSLLVPSLQ